MEAIRSFFRSLFSARVLGSVGIIAGFACLTLAVAFVTVWKPVIDADAFVYDRGVFQPLTARLGMAYSGIVIFLCSIVTMNLWDVRRRIAGLLGEQWKLTTTLAGILLIVSVLYFLLAFAVTHINFVAMHPEHRNFYYATFFGREVLMPTLRFTREDIFTAFFMALSGFISFGMFVFLSLNAGTFRSKLPGELWGAMGFGFLFLAADELFDIHRLLGRNLPFLRDLSIRTEPGYIVFGFYGVVGIVLFFAYRKDLLRNSAASRALLLGVFLQCLALGLDMWGRFQRREEILEIGEAGLWFAAVVYYMYDEIDSYITSRIERTSSR